VRQAAGLAIDCQGTNEALTLGYSEVTGNAIVPKGYDFYWQPPARYTTRARPSIRSQLRPVERAAFLLQ